MENTTYYTDFSQLEQLNEDRANLLIPVMVYLGILSVSGIIGNTLVLYIYKRTFRRTNHRNFILWLAILDVFGSVFGIPFELVHMRYTFMFYEVEMCRIGGFLITSISCAGSMVLVAIATDSYLKICRPFGKQLTPKMVSLLCLFACVAGLALSWPNILFWGYTTVETGVDNITGVDCFISDHYKNTKFPFIYDMALCVMFLFSAIIMSFLYISIAKRLRHGYLFRKEHMVSQNKEKEPESLIIHKSRLTSERDSSDLSSIDSQNQRKRSSSDSCKFPNATKELFDVKNDRGSKNKNSSFTKNSSSIKNRRDSKLSTLSGSLRFWRKPKTMNATRRITVLMFLVTLVFIISFVPHLIIRAITNMKNDFVGSLQDKHLVIYNIFFRSYFVNHMSNPILYGLMDKKFKNQVRKLFLLIFCCRR